MARQLGIWPDRSEPWHAARRWRVGGSDIGVIMGWGAYPISAPKSRSDLLVEKLAEPAEIAPTTGAEGTKGARRRGVYLEPAVKAWLADRDEITYYPDRSAGTWVSDKHDWMLYNPDAVAQHHKRGDALCEFKTCDVRDAEHGWGRAGTDAVPLAYAAQCQWGMAVLDLDVTLLAVLSGAPRFEFARYVIKRDQNVINYLIAEASRFRDELLTMKGSQP